MRRLIAFLLAFAVVLSFVPSQPVVAEGEDWNNYDWTNYDWNNNNNNDYWNNNNWNNTEWTENNNWNTTEAPATTEPLKPGEVVYVTAVSCSEGAIQDCLYEAKRNATATNPYYVRVPEGYMNMVYGLHIYSNTTLDLTNVKIHNPCKRSGAIIQVGYPRREGGKDGSVELSKSAKGYKKGGYKRGKNIKVINGTLDGGTKAGIVSSLVTFSHVQNITFDGVTFTFKPTKKDDAHPIEFGAAKNVVIKDCKFIGNHKVCEALQIESAVKNVAHSDLMGKEDGTKTKNVTISGCTFDNFEYAMGTNHGCKKDVYKSMVIRNNTFKNIKKYCVCTYNYHGKITGNSATKCGSRRVFKLGKKNKLTIKKNKW